MKYSLFVVIGKGRLAFQCGEYLKENYQFPVILYDVNDKPSSYLKSNCSKIALDYRSEPKQQIFSSLCETEEQTLIISACNHYIIPADVLEKHNISAINFHNALLPAHPGRNAEAWTIYEMDEYAGITWHILSEKVDKGAIIAQEKIKPDNEMTSAKLLAIQNEKAFISFKDFIASFLNDSCTLTQQINEKHPFHFSKDRPNNGELDLNWSTDKISAFLRAYDYGLYNVLGKPHLVYEGTVYQWRGYKLTNCEHCEKTVIVRDGDMLIKEGDTEIHLTRLTPISDKTT